MMTSESFLWSLISRYFSSLAADLVQHYIKTRVTSWKSPKITSDIPAASTSSLPFFLLAFVWSSVHSWWLSVSRVSPFNWTPLLLLLRPHGKVCRHILIWLWLKNQTMLARIPASNKQTVWGNSRARQRHGQGRRFDSLHTSSDSLKTSFNYYVLTLFRRIFCLSVCQTLLYSPSSSTEEVELRRPLQAGGVTAHTPTCFLFSTSFKILSSITRNLLWSSNTNAQTSARDPRERSRFTTNKHQVRRIKGAVHSILLSSLHLHSFS